MEGLPMARRTPQNAPKGTATRNPAPSRAASAATVPPVAVAVAPGPFLAIHPGTAGRPPAGFDALADAALSILADALAAYKVPAPAVAPRGASPRIRAAYAADAATVAGAVALARESLARGRARNRA